MLEGVVEWRCVTVVLGVGWRVSPGGKVCDGEGVSGVSEGEGNGVSLAGRSSRTTAACPCRAPKDVKANRIRHTYPVRITPRAGLEDKSGRVIFPPMTRRLCSYLKWTRRASQINRTRFVDYRKGEGQLKNAGVSAAKTDGESASNSSACSSTQPSVPENITFHQ